MLSVFHTKRTSATAARRSPVPFARRPRSRLGNPARLRRSGGGVGSPCLRLCLPRCATLETRSRATSPTPPAPGFTHARGDDAGFLPPLRQPAAARHRSRLSLSASGSSVSNQAGLLQNNIAAISIGVNRPGCVPCRAGSRLGFYRSPATAMRSSHRLFAARFRSLPGETRLTKGFCPFPPPIRQ